MQLDTVRTDRCPCAVVDPIASIEIVASGVHFDQHGNVAVPESDQLDRRVVRQFVTGKRFELRSPGTAGVRVSLPGFGVADEAHQKVRPIRMQMTERITRWTTLDEPLEHSIAKVSITESVAMCQEGGLPTDLCYHRSVDQLDSDLIRQEDSTPGVVISPDQTDAYTGVDKIGQSLQGSKVPAEYYRPILKPEVEQVAVDYEVTSSPSSEFKELMKRSLAGFRGGAEVGVRYDYTRELTHSQQYTEVR